MEPERTYIAIDLKSFYASVECVQRDLDPLDTNLVVADSSRTEKTICLAVSPALKAFGVPGRPRLFEVNQKVNEINELRKYHSGRDFIGKSIYRSELIKDERLKLDFIIAGPRMAEYIKVSNAIYAIYLKFISKDDIHVYSIDEVFIDATKYLKAYKMSAYELAGKLASAVFSNTGITATVGIGSNLYLCKVAMDIIAKKCPPDKNGLRIACLDEMSYRTLLWEHVPITDFWRVGRGYAAKLAANNLYTMGDIALKSIYNEDALYKLFGVNAETLIDHAWGWESVTIEQIKAYKPKLSSLSSGQVLPEAYESGKARVLLKEMAELLSLELVHKCLITDNLGLTVCYDGACVSQSYSGEVKIDYYGRIVPKDASSSVNLHRYTASTKIISEAVLALYDRITDKSLFVRRLYISANRVIPAEDIIEDVQQLSLFDEPGSAPDRDELEKEKRLQQAIIGIQDKFGKNAVLKCYNLYDWARTRERNEQIGGHKM